MVVKERFYKLLYRFALTEYCGYVSRQISRFNMCDLINYILKGFVSKILFKLFFFTLCYTMAFSELIASPLSILSVEEK